MVEVQLRSRTCVTERHTTTYLEAGPADGPLMLFVHGFPGLGIIWKRQIEHFARQGWRCVAPDVRGYGGSSVPGDRASYTVAEGMLDMVELHDHLGGSPAVWIGHDWGTEIVWALAAKEPARCRASVGVTVPYLPGGFTLQQVVPFIDRSVYPDDVFPLGQWEYMRYQVEHPQRLADEFAADTRATFLLMYRSGDPAAVGEPAFTANVRNQGGWFGPAGRAPLLDRDETVLSQDLLDALVTAYGRTGFLGANAWYDNALAVVPAGSAASSGTRLEVPVLFVHATYDTVCDTAHTGLADPMRAACDDLTEVSIDAGHWVFLERADEFNRSTEEWLHAIGAAASDPSSPETRAVDVVDSAS